MLAQCSYTIECVYSDNGREYQEAQEHLSVKTCNNRFINDYNTVKPHKGIFGKTLYEVLDDYVKQDV